MSFSNFGLHADLLRGVSEANYTEPTPIQRDAIPAGIAGRDVLACSATGSGKTAAFLLPILQRLHAAPRHGVTRALILTPTRELAAQIGENLASLARHARIGAATVVGGVGMGAQKHALQNGVAIVVATPGRLMDHLRYPYAKLGGVEMLVLDEADRMLDMGFLPDIKRIVQHLPAQRQTFFFSATLPSEIVSLTKQWLKDPARINIERQARPAEGIRQSMYPVPHSLKSMLLARLLKNEGMKSVLVFTRTKRRADRVADVLKRNQVSSTRIHGDRTQGQRTQAMEGFKKGRYQVLVATDVAARGIDVNALSHVVNFDLPGSSEDYIHRIGRTARAQATGDALTFVAPDEERDWKAIERAVGAAGGKVPVERIVLQDFDYTALPPAVRNERSEHGERRERAEHGHRAGNRGGRTWQNREQRESGGRQFNGRGGNRGEHGSRHQPRRNDDRGSGFRPPHGRPQYAPAGRYDVDGPRDNEDFGNRREPERLPDADKDGNSIHYKPAERPPQQRGRGAQRPHRPAGAAHRNAGGSPAHSHGTQRQNASGQPARSGQSGQKGNGSWRPAGERTWEKPSWKSREAAHARHGQPSSSKRPGNQ